MIKRFNPDFSLSISHELAYMRETPEGGYVAHGDYATLFSELESVRAERDALAVKNAELKKFCKDAAFDADYESGLGMERGGFTDALNNIETPATDAALAAIRADAMAEGADACVRALVTSDDDDFTDAPNICAMVARQLREAK